MSSNVGMIIRGYSSVVDETMREKIKLLNMKCVNLCDSHWESKLVAEVTIKSSDDDTKCYWYAVSGYKHAIPVETMCQIGNDMSANDLYYLPRDNGFVFKFTDIQDLKKATHGVPKKIPATFYRLAKKLKALKEQKCKDLFQNETNVIFDIAARLCSEFCCSSNLTIIHQSVSENYTTGERTVSVLYKELYDVIDCFQLSYTSFPGKITFYCQEGGLKFTLGFMRKRTREENNQKEIDESSEVDLHEQIEKMAKIEEE